MKEEKLTLRHLSGYLPYGLNCRHPETGDADLMIFGASQECIMNGVGDLTLKFSDIKLLLIPLSELTEEQWVEVFKAGYNGADITEFVNKHQLHFQTHTNSIEIYCNGYTSRYRFDIQQFDVGVFRFNQHAAFEKLYELHADLENLIESGCAISKLDLK